MKPALLAWAASLGLSVAVAVPATAAPGTAVPATTRKVVLARVDSKYQWKLIESPVPAVGEHQVLVHVRAVSLNRGDLEMLDPDPRNDITGLLVGSDAAGDVVAVGSKVKGIRKGTRVTSTYFRNWVDGPPSREKLQHAHGASVDGVFGDYVVLEDSAVVPIAAGLSYEEAATLPTAGLTGWMATAGQHEIHAGEVVVVQGTGGVSIFAAQFAAASGARVIVTSSSDEKLQRARAIGAKDGINYRTVPEWSTKVLELTDQHGADIVVDVGGKDTLEQSAKSLAYLGTISIVGGLTGYGGSIPAGRLLNKVARAQGVFVGSRADFLRMNAFIVRHHLHPVIDGTFSLDQYAEALQHMESGSFVGKIVLKL